MRPAAVSPLLLLAACAAGGPEAVFVEDFVDRSPVLECRAAEVEGPPGSVVRLRTVNDSLLAVIAEGDREILLLTHDLALVARVPWAQEGPGTLVDPVDVELLGDTLLAVAEQGRARLTFLDLAGGDRGSRLLGVTPQRILRHGDGWLVSTIPLLMTQGEILHRVAGDGISGMGVPPVHKPQIQLKAMANTTVLERVGTSRVILGHQFIEPTVHLLDIRPGDAAARAVRRVGTPLPDGVRGAVGYLPEPPFRDEDLRRMLTPILESSPDPLSGGLLYLTRTGREEQGYWEKALIRVDGDMNYVESFRLPVNVGPFVYLPGQREIVAVAEDESWHRCRLPSGREG